MSQAGLSSPAPGIELKSQGKGQLSRGLVAVFSLRVLLDVGQADVLPLGDENMLNDPLRSTDS